ncbi:UNVERIFIED_CONTAM: hypothetical protein HDU68_002169 [Siphonaria sp. JEL0065]|nr:hypothetical protein HDU68_002169 [Siphonaria sp. JEL0065]
MSGIFTGPVRAGNRGGTGLFKWDTVKDDKHRENYLGHSINAPVGRWQKGKDLGWYAKNKDDESSASGVKIKEKEVRDIKELEAEAMAEALGLKVKKTGKSSVSQAEIQRLLKLDSASQEEVVDETVKAKGLGFGRLDTASFKPKFSGNESDSSSDDGQGGDEERLDGRVDITTEESGQGTKRLRSSEDDDSKSKKKSKKEKKEKKEKSRKEKKEKKEKRKHDKH